MICRLPKSRFRVIQCQFLVQLLGICCFCSGHSQAQVSESNASATVPRLTESQAKVGLIAIECQATITRRGSGTGEREFLVADVDAQPLEGGKKYRFNIVLVNPFTTDVTFSSVDVSCDCIKFSGPKDNVIPALGFASFVMDLDVPNSVSRRTVRQQARFVGPDSIESVLILNVEYELNNVFGFPQSQVAAKVSKSVGAVEVVVPFMVVPPLTLDDLELRVSENLRDFGARVVNDDSALGSPCVKLMIPSKDVPKNGIMGQLSLVRTGTEQQSSAMVSVKRKEQIEIRPETVRFSWNRETEKYDASAILRIAPDSEVRTKADFSDSPEAEKTERREPVEVHLLIDGTPAQVAVKKLGQSGVYRLTIRHSGQFDGDSSDTVSVRWKVVANGQELSVDSTAVFQKF